jgi:hypothetical protein
MEWHYSKNGQQHGPVNEAELIAMVQNGSVAPTDLAWNKGMDGWKPVSEIAALNAQAASPAPSMTSPPIQTAPSQAPKRLTQEQKAQIYELKEQMKQEYERFVEETHMRAKAKCVGNMQFGLLKKISPLRGDGLRQKRTDKIEKSWSPEGGSVYDYPENPDEVFYFEDGCIKDANNKYTLRIGTVLEVSAKKHRKYLEQAESIVKAEQKGKYALDFPSCDEFMEWRWRDLDNRGGLEDGLIEAMQLCD